MALKTLQIKCPDGKDIGTWTERPNYPNSTDITIYFRDEWQWPEWIKPGMWLAQNKSEEWSLFEVQPRRYESCWECPGASGYQHGFWLLHFEPPPCDDWTQSLRQKPEE